MYGFRAMTAADLPLVNDWIAAPHVADWWVEADGPAELMTEADLGEPGFIASIVSLDGRPFAYMQDYDPHLYTGHHFSDRPAGTRGIDQFIGEAHLVERGHGTAFIRQRVDTLFAEGVPVVVTDPAPANARAIRAYQKAGFAVYAEIVSPDYGPCLLMQCVKS